MKTLNLKTTVFAIVCFIYASNRCDAQQGSVSVNQDKKIVTLLDLKKDMNKNESDTDRYKIQIYSGNRTTAETYRSDFNSKFDKWNSTIQFETPNYKIWVGNFRTKIEADRALKEIKQKFSSAFVFKPKK
ncbi:SPOR domain-containing protein [Confluentibacter lentus]|uniref:SPOR domain-containing protein n=1 Tax=Confluentibacter lentus TaxID=1699412 RepID=UPI000C291476|nr:SPOR domain-containing protein [Confluentibacter lentus]